MFRSRQTVPVTLVWSVVLAMLFLLGRQPAQAADPAILKLIPENALGFAAINNLAQTDAKLIALSGKVGVPVPGSPLMMAKMSFGIQGGLDEKGTAFVAVLPSQAQLGPPSAIICLPVTDYKQFIGQLNPSNDSGEISQVQVGPQQVLVGKKGNYAAFAQPDQGDVLEAFLAASGDISGEMTLLTSYIRTHDLVGVMTRAGLKQATAAARQGLQSATDAFAQGPQADDSQFQMVREMFGFYENLLGLVQEGVTNVAVGAQITDDGAVHLTSRSLFDKGSDLAEMARSIDPPKEGLLTGLPEGQFVMAFDGVMPQKLSERMAGMSANMMKNMTMLPGASGKLSPEDSERLTEVMKRSMEGVRSMAMVMGAGQGDDSLYANTSALFRVDDSQKYLENYRALMKEMNTILKNVGSDALKPYEIQDVKVGGATALQITMDMSAFAAANNDPNAQRMLEMMFGEGGKLNAYLAQAGKNAVAMAYSERELQEVLALAKSGDAGLAENPEVQATSAMLPKGAQWAGYISPSGIMSLTQRMMAAMGNQAPPIALPAFGKTPPIGFAARAVPEGLATHLVLPAPVLEEIGKFVGRMQQQMMQGGNPQIP